MVPCSMSLLNAFFLSLKVGTHCCASQRRVITARSESTLRRAAQLITERHLHWIVLQRFLTFSAVWRNSVYTPFLQATHIPWLKWLCLVTSFQMLFFSVSISFLEKNNNILTRVDFVVMSNPCRLPVAVLDKRQMWTALFNRVGVWDRIGHYSLSQIYPSYHWIAKADSM